MLLSQELGWPVMNGYSGNLPDGYGETSNCDDAVTRIVKYMYLEKIEDPTFYNDLLSRVVSVGPEDCQWPTETPSLSFVESSGAFSQELFSGTSIKILSMTRKENYPFRPNLWLRTIHHKHYLRILLREINFVYPGA